VVTKKEYQEEMEARLGELEAQIEELMAQATRSDYDDYLTDIRAKQEIAKAKLAELKKASGESWQELEAQLDKAVSEVQNALFVATADSG
jgi:DNA repair exonuclease SbcCD ATPase subunit